MGKTAPSPSKVAWPSLVGQVCDVCTPLQVTPPWS